MFITALSAAFPVWKKLRFIKLGTTPCAIRRHLQGKGVFTSSLSEEAVGKDNYYSSRYFESVKGLMFAHLVKVTPRQLGLSENDTEGSEMVRSPCFTVEVLMERALAYGLEKCNTQVGPQLRFCYSDQPRGERIYVMMSPVLDIHNKEVLYVLMQSRDGVSNLRHVPCTHVFGLDDNLIFTKPYINKRRRY